MDNESDIDIEAFQGDETILVVDDEASILEITEEILQKHGYRTVSADCGEAALTTYEEHGPSIGMVILDLGMPGMGGMECLKQLLILNPETKVLIASGYSDETRAANSIEAGAKNFISKPYQIGKLLKSVRGILDSTAN